MERIELRPQQGPQERFLSTRADIAFYGGAAGAGKTYASVFGLARHVGITGYRGVFFRRTMPEITGAGGPWEESLGIYPYLGGLARVSPSHDWRFPSGARIQFTHLKDEATKLRHQGRQYAKMVFDEVTHFTSDQFWYLQSRNRTTCGVRPDTRATCNPVHKGFVRDMVDWWIGEDGYPIPERSGVLRWFVRDGDDLVWADTPDILRARYAHVPEHERPIPKSFTFIPAKLSDNRILTAADPAYRATLLSLPRLERLRLLGGNWNVAPSAGMYYQRVTWRVVDAPPGQVLARVRAWDKAATEPHQTNPDPDWTVGVKMSLGHDRCVYVEDVVRFRGGPLDNERHIKATAERDGRTVPVAFWRDPGQAGVVDMSLMTRLLHGWIVLEERTHSDKETFTRPLAGQHQRGNTAIVRASWNDQYTDEMEQFPVGTKDDGVDASSLGYLKLLELCEGSLEMLTKL